MVGPNIPQPRPFGTGTRRPISPQESLNRPKNDAARRLAARFRCARRSRGWPPVAACPRHPLSPPLPDRPALSQRTRSEDQTQRWLQPDGLSCLLPRKRFYAARRVRATAHRRTVAARSMLKSLTGAGDRSRTASAVTAAPRQPRPAHGSSGFDGKPGPL